MYLLNSVINELRYINADTYFCSWMIISLFNDVEDSIQEQISRILIERLQTHDPHPWGLCITFRELLQNPKYNFANKPFVQRNLSEIDKLMATKLHNFYPYWQNNKQIA
jgi:CCR4-NOT transcription complex subunit 1